VILPRSAEKFWLDTHTDASYHNLVKAVKSICMELYSVALEGQYVFVLIWRNNGNWVSRKLQCNYSM